MSQPSPTAGSATAPEPNPHKPGTIPDGIPDRTPGGIPNSMAASGEEGGDPACWAHLFEEGTGPDDTQLARLVRGLADAVIICDSAGNIVLWNDAATRLFGFSADEAFGQPLDLIIPERLRTRHWEGYRTVMHTGHTDYGDRLLEVPALHKDGRRLSIAFTVSLLTEPGRSTPVGIAAVIRDDTARWQQQRETQKELSALRATAQSGQEA